MIHEIIHSRIFLLTLTVAVYYGSYQLYERWKFALLNPLLVSVVLLITLLQLLGINYTEYYEANSIINFLLSLSVVALAYLFEQNIEHIRENKLSILTSIFIGSLVSILSIRLIAWIMGADDVIIASIQTRSVTTPIAISISENSGGIAALTSVAVILGGILGSVIGPWLLNLFRVHDSVARGLAMGAASHAIGTSRALEMGAIEGAVGGAAIGLMGIITAILIPIIEKITSF